MRAPIAALVVAACAPPAPTPAAAPDRSWPAPIASIAPPDPTADPGALEQDAGADADAGGTGAPDAPSDPERVVRASMRLAPRLEPCRFVFGAGVGGVFDYGRFIMGVERIEVEPSADCAGHVVYDGEAEKAKSPDGLDVLEGGLLPNPDKLAQAAKQTDGAPSIWVDANFDGYLDIRVLALSGAYNSSHRFWLFDPKTKRFVQSTALEELLMPQFDAKKRRVASGGRAGGPVYVSSQHEWVNGTLEQVWSETTILGEAPSGKPLPKGFGRWRTRYERRGTSMKKVFDGPAR